MLYFYSAKTYSGENTKGEIESVDQFKAVKELKERQLIVLEIKEKKSTFDLSFLRFGVSLKEKVIFLSQLTMMLKSGLPLVEALEALKEQTSNKQFVEIIDEISIAIRGGKSLSESMQKYPNVFPSLYIGVISSGEKSGKLDEVTDRLAKQMQKDDDLYSKIKNALMYPAVILVAIAGVLTLVLVYIMPQVKKIFDDMNITLPLLTRMILGVSSFTEHFWWLIILIIIGIIIIFRSLLNNYAFKYAWDRMQLSLPIFGPFIKKIYMSRFTSNLATLVSAGLPMLEALDTTKGVVSNVIYQNAMERIYKDIENGVQFSASLKKEKVFPAMIAQLVNIGEKSGKLDLVLTDLSDFFDKEVENITRNLTTLLEPILTIIMGIGVALVVASVILPIYGLVNVI